MCIYVYTPSAPLLLTVGVRNAQSASVDTTSSPWDATHSSVIRGVQLAVVKPAQGRDIS